MDKEYRCTKEGRAVPEKKSVLGTLSIWVLVGGKLKLTS